jgi:two-component system NtrC family sensor kinase
VYLGLELLDAQGKVLARAGQSGADHADAAWLQLALGRPFVLGPPPSAQSPEFFVTVRITSGRQVWLLRAQLDPGQIEAKMRAFHPGGAGGAFILGPGGEVHGPSSSTTALSAATISTLGQQIFPENKPVLVESADAAGTMTIHACAPLTTISGILVFHQPKKHSCGPCTLPAPWPEPLSRSAWPASSSRSLAMSRRMQQRLLKAELLQQQMQQQVVEAGKLAAIGEMAAGIAHEINNPLAIMMENAGWIQDLLKSDETQPRNMDGNPGLAADHRHPGPPLQGDHAQASELRPQDRQHGPRGADQRPAGGHRRLCPAESQVQRRDHPDQPGPRAFRKSTPRPRKCSRLS